jgi:hypothetical protein
MGLRFDMKWANWIAYLTVPGKTPPRSGSHGDDRMAIDGLIQQLEHGFYSTARERSRWLDMLDMMRMRMGPRMHEGGPELALLQQYLQSRPWFALIVPSGSDRETDRFLCSRDFLREAVDVRPDDPGLILQIDQPPEGQLSLTDAFPAFRTALANSAQWPGVLLWSGANESIFLPFDTDGKESIRKNVRWIFSHLAASLGADLEQLQILYEREFPRAKSRRKRAVHMIHVSDVHLGCREARDRLPRVQQLIRNVINEMGDPENVVPILSGDIVDSPNEAFLGEANAFLDFLSGLGTLSPVVVLGNHDVRKGGVLGEDFKSAFRLPTTKVVWLDEQQVGILPFNSVMAGELAQGSIGEQQLVGVGNEIDRRENWKKYALFAVLHHHPMPVEQPDWYQRNFLERWFGPTEEKSMALLDAESFLNWVEARKVAAVLHGHRHIPRIAETPKLKIPVFGCGSTVGKVPTNDGRPYMSLNVITYEPGSRRVFGRLLAERIPGGGLDETRRHELVSLGHSA